MRDYTDTHTLYERKDFTEEEIARRNVIAVAVLEDGVIACKICGRTGDLVAKKHCHVSRKFDRNWLQNSEEE